MDTKALEFYRGESKCTENSVLVGKEPILYVDNQRIRGARNRFVDQSRSSEASRYYGTPGEYNAVFAPSKYISVVSPPDKGKYMFVSYTSSPSLTTNKVFPGIQNNANGRTEGSPFHVVPLYFAGRASLVLDRAINSNNYKSWV
tara:strand:- start:8519 stop:8950 length:432 start_codon:yes stop_codon:yes gene_type:complete